MLRMTLKTINTVRFNWLTMVQWYGVGGTEQGCDHWAVFKSSRGSSLNSTTISACLPPPPTIPEQRTDFCSVLTVRTRVESSPCSWYPRRVGNVAPSWLTVRLPLPPNILLLLYVVYTGVGKHMPIRIQYNTQHTSSGWMDRWGARWMTDAPWWSEILVNNTTRSGTINIFVLGALENFSRQNWKFNVVLHIQRAPYSSALLCSNGRHWHNNAGDCFGTYAWGKQADRQR